jgi:hypothetical protein
MFLCMNFQLSNRLRRRHLTSSWSTRLAIVTTFSVAAAVDVLSYFDKETVMDESLAGLLWHLLQSLLPLRNFRFAPKATDGSNTYSWMASGLYEKVPHVRNTSTSLQTAAVAANIYSLATWSLHRSNLLWGVKTRCVAGIYMYIGLVNVTE